MANRNLSTLSGLGSTLLPLPLQHANILKPQSNILKPLTPNGPRTNNYNYKTNLLNSDDPYQMNSYADVVSRSVVDLLGGRLDKSLWNLLSGTAGVWYNSMLKPLLNTNKDGQWRPDFVSTGINGLINFGETMDFLANPVKALVLGEGTMWDRLKSGFGEYDDSGLFRRKTYNYNIDMDPDGKWDGVPNWFANTFLEVISDPMNLITFGVSGLLNAGVDITTEGFETLAPQAQKLASKAMKNATKEYINNGASKEFMEYFTEAFSKLTKNPAVTKIQPAVAKAIMDDIANGTIAAHAGTIAKSIAQLGKGANTVQEAISSIAKLGSGGLGLGVMGVKKVWSMTMDAGVSTQINRLTNATRKLLTKKGDVDVMKYDEFIKTIDGFNNTMELTAKINKDPNFKIDTNYLKQQTITSITADISRISYIIRANLNDPSKMFEELWKAYPEASSSSTVLIEWLESLKLVSKTLGGEFDEDIVRMEEMIKAVTHMHEVSLKKTSAMAVDKIVSDTDAITQKFTTDLNPLHSKVIEDKLRLIDDMHLDPEAGSKKLSSLHERRQKLEYEIKNTDKKNVQKIAQLQNELDEVKYTQKHIRKLNEVIKNLQGENFYGLYTDDAFKLQLLMSSSTFEGSGFNFARSLAPIEAVIDEQLFILSKTVGSKKVDMIPMVLETVQKAVDDMFKAQNADFRALVDLSNIIGRLKEFDSVAYEFAKLDIYDRLFRPELTILEQVFVDFKMQLQNELDMLFKESWSSGKVDEKALREAIFGKDGLMNLMREHADRTKGHIDNLNNIAMIMRSNAKVLQDTVNGVRKAPEQFFTGISDYVRKAVSDKKFIEEISNTIREFGKVTTAEQKPMSDMKLKDLTNFINDINKMYGINASEYEVTDEMLEVIKLAKQAEHEFEKRFASQEYLDAKIYLRVTEETGSKGPFVIFEGQPVTLEEVQAKLTTLETGIKLATDMNEIDHYLQFTAEQKKLLAIQAELEFLKLHPEKVEMRYQQALKEVQEVYELSELTMDNRGAKYLEAKAEQTTEAYKDCRKTMERPPTHKPEVTHNDYSYNLDELNAKIQGVSDEMKETETIRATTTGPAYYRKDLYERINLVMEARRQELSELLALRNTLAPRQAIFDANVAKYEAAVKYVKEIDDRVAYFQKRMNDETTNLYNAYKGGTEVKTFSDVLEDKVKENWVGDYAESFRQAFNMLKQQDPRAFRNVNTEVLAEQYTRLYEIIRLQQELYMDDKIIDPTKPFLVQLGNDEDASMSIVDAWLELDRSVQNAIRNLDMEGGETDAVRLLKEMETKLTELGNPYALVDNMLQVTEKGVVYALKMENTYTNFRLLNLTGVTQITDSIMMNDKLGQLLNGFADFEYTLAESGTEMTGAIDASKMIVGLAKQYQLYKEFSNELINLDIDEIFKTPLISIIQKYYKLNNSQLLSNPNYYMNEIFQQMEVFANSKGQTLPKLNLESLVEIPEIRDMLVKMKLGNIKNHDAFFDVAVVEAALKHFGYFDDLINSTAKDIWVLDIETSNFQARTGSIQQIAMRNLKTGETINLKTAINTADVTQQVNRPLLNKFGFNSMDEYAKARSGDLTEQQLLEQFTKFLADRGGAEKLAIMAHNGELFDFNFISERLKAVGMIPEMVTQKQYETIDSLTFLREKMGFKTLAPEQKRRITDRMLAYAQRGLDAGVDKFVFSGYSELATSIGEMAKHMNDIMKAIKERDFKTRFKINTSDISDGMIADLRNVARTIFDELRDIGRDNRELRKILITSDIINNKEMYSKFIQTLTDSGIDTSKLGSPSNIIQLLYGLDDSMSRMYGLKKVADWEFLRGYFDIQIGQQMSGKKVTYMQSVAEQVSKTAERIRNVELLQVSTDSINSIYEQIMNGPLKDLYPILSEMRYAEDAYTRFAVIDWFLNRLDTQNKWTEEIAQALKPEQVWDIRDIQQGLQKNFKRSFAKLEELHPRQYALWRETFRNGTVGMFEDISENITEHGFIRTAAMNQARVVLPAVELVDSYHAMLSNLDTNWLPVWREASDNITKYTVNNIMQLTPDELLRHMAYNAPFMTLNPSTTYYQQVIDAWFSRANEYSKVGINMHVSPKTGVLTLSLDGSLNLRRVVEEINDGFGRKSKGAIMYLNDIAMERLDLKELDFDEILKDLPEDFRNQFMSWRKHMRDTTLNRISGTEGGLLSHHKLEVLQANLDPAVLKNMKYLEDVFPEQTMDGVLFNTVQLNGKGDIMQQIVDGAEHIASHTSAKILMADAVFSGDFGIQTSALFNQNPAEVLKALKEHPEYSLVVLVEDKRFGFKFKKINVRTEEHLAKAMKLNATMIPTSMVTKFSDVLNLSIWTQNKTLKFMQFMMYTFKAGYLTSPAGMLRNEFDSTLKTGITTGDYAGAIFNQAEAKKLLGLSDKAVHDIMLLNQLDLQKIEALGLRDGLEQALTQVKIKDRITAQQLVSGFYDCVDDIVRMDRKRLIRSENVQFYFKKMNPAMTEEMFQFMWKFLNDSASGGELSSMGIARSFNGLDQTQTVNPIKNTIHMMYNRLLSGTEEVERINRLTEYLTLARQGTDDVKTFYNIIKAHFDYGDKTDIQKGIEMLFPFYTFTMKNMDFWYDVFMNQPQLLNYLNDVGVGLFSSLGLSTDPDTEDYTKNVARNGSLRSALLNGSIPLWDTGMTLKASPSFLDAFKLMVNPIGTLQEKLFSPIGNLLDSVKEGAGWSTGSQNIDLQGGASQAVGKWLDNVPLIGTMYNRYFNYNQEYYKRSGNPLNLVLPDMFGAIKQQPDPGRTFKGNFNYDEYKQQQQLKKYFKKPRRPAGKGRVARPNRVVGGSRALRNMSNRTYTRRPYQENNVRRMYRKSGTSRWAPLTWGGNSGQILKYRINDMKMFLRR